MLYLLVTFFVISGLASAVVLAAFMRSAQITHHIEQHGMPAMDSSTPPFCSLEKMRSRGHLTSARRLTTAAD